MQYVQIQKDGYSRVQGHRELTKMFNDGHLAINNELQNFTPYAAARRHRGKMTIYSVRPDSGLGAKMLGN